MLDVLNWKVKSWQIGKSFLRRKKLFFVDRERNFNQFNRKLYQMALHNILGLLFPLGVALTIGKRSYHWVNWVCLKIYVSNVFIYIFFLNSQALLQLAYFTGIVLVIWDTTTLMTLAQIFIQDQALIQGKIHRHPPTQQPTKRKNVASAWKIWNDSRVWRRCRAFTNFTRNASTVGSATKCSVQTAEPSFPAKFWVIKSTFVT